MRCISKLARLFALCLVAFPGAASAQDILPVAQGRYSVTFVQDDKSARLQPGAVVVFIGTTHKNIPTKLRIEDGFVLGTRGDVVFVEVSERGAEILAHRRASQEIRIRKTLDPDPEMVAARRKAADEDQSVLLAPRLQAVSLTIEIAKERVEAWARGTRLTFPDAFEVKRISYIDDRTRSSFYDIEAQFVSGVQTDGEHREITVIARPKDAFALLKAEAEGRLGNVVAEGEEPRAKDDPRCYVTKRSGSERVRIEIPCN